MILTTISDCLRINGADGKVLENGKSIGDIAQNKTVAPKNGFASFQLVIDTECAFDAIEVKADFSDGLSVDLYEEWFIDIEGALVPDCLIPLKDTGVLRTETRASGRYAVVWADVYVSASCKAGEHAISLTVSASGIAQRAVFTLFVPDYAYPKTGRIVCDLNNYADSLSSQYQFLKNDPERYRNGSYFAVERAYFQMAREHRCLFHNLPYKHSGNITEGYAPELEGEGKDIRVKDWSLFDEHFAPLLTGEAFKDSKVSTKPLEYMYLPFHLGWPSSYEKWGHKGYKTEYRRILTQFVQHFEEKGWLGTKCELFLNHKKDYRFFPYTADEIWYKHDEEVMDKWYEVIEGAYESTKVPFITRMDSSNYFGVHHNNHRFADWFKLWVVGKGMFNWYPESVAAFREHGNTLWVYGDVLKDMRTSLLSLYQWPIHCLMTGADGFCVWNTNGTGASPLTKPHANGQEMLFYPGEHFGINGPLASIRLKTLRNAVQVCELAADMPKGRVHKFVNNLFGMEGDQSWWREKPDFVDTPPRYWDFGEAFGNAIVKPLYLGKEPEMSKQFRDGILSLPLQVEAKEKSSGFRYY